MTKILDYPVSHDPSFAKNNTRIRFTFVTREENGSAVLQGKTGKIPSIQAIDNNSPPVNPYTSSLEESRLCAEHYVTSMEEYTGYGGTNLTLSGSNHDKMPFPLAFCVHVRYAIT